ncbi:MAG: DNA repair exonuclease [Rhodopirellula sp.]|nr:DNA repair exonuclease [Rhodopirellula sp.]
MPSDSFRFIHAADIHIDSPLRGLEAYEGAPVERLRNATREAFENLVQLAIDEAVAFVIIAGDLFDGQWKDMNTGIWTARQFRKLEQAGIPVCLIRGNHDAESKVRTGIKWPSNVREFSVRKPETLTAGQLGLPESMAVAVHGQGFAKPDIQEDLAAEYPEALSGCFNIGVLHTSLTGDPAHDRYAATTLEVLRNRNYDYWALGHIHIRSEPPLSETPFAAFSGNTQGRHIRETGPKGCLLVSVEDGGISSTEFRKTDTLRWHRAEVTLDSSDGLNELYDKTRDALQTCLDLSDGRFAAIRIEISGACAAHRELAQPGTQHEVISQIRDIANEWDDEIWIEKVKLNTSPPINVDQLRQGQDLLGELLRDVESLSTDQKQLAKLVAESLASLSSKAGPELQAAETSLTDPEQLQAWLQQAEGLLLARLEAEA